MLRGLKPYDAYRSSGTPWMPRVPHHWRSPRIKTVLVEKNVRGFPGEPLLTATQSRGVIRKSDYASRTVTAEKSLDLLKLVEIGDFVISLRSFQGGIERAHARGIISPAYTILKARDSNDADYLTLLFKSRPFVDALTLTVTGIREGQNIEYPRLARDLLPLPSRDEQEAIVKYLGHAHARIDRAITAKRKLIALLEEQKQAIINQAVTRGLDPTVAMKDSGIPWIGEMPAHWDVYPLKSLCEPPVAGVWGDEASHTNMTDHVTCIRVADFDFAGLRISHSNLTVRAVPARARERRLLKSGDILVEKSGGTARNPVGRLVVFDEPFAAVTSNFVARYRPITEMVRPLFLANALASGYRVGVTWPAVRQTTGIQNVSSREYGATPVPVPPLAEQVRILDAIREEAELSDSIRARAASELDLLLEYRTRLTSDVVTGQLDVRGIAAALPEFVVPVSVDADASDDGSLEDLDDLLEEVDA